MHPILAHRGRLGIYVAAWVAVAGLLAMQIVMGAAFSWVQAVALALPLSIFFAFVCLASWYPCRAMQFGKARLPALATTQLLSAVFAALLWLMAGIGWARFLSGFERFSGIDSRFSSVHTVFAAAGVLLYLLVAAGHYLILAVQASQDVESRNLELQVRARDAELLAVKAERARELANRELELARTIQRRLLPAPDLDGEGFRVSARNLPAQFVAGDFYDIFRLPDGSLALVVADVAGKGVGASLIMASVKAMLPLIAARHSVTETMDELNVKLAAELAPREFVALSLARYAPQTRQIELANAGLPDPYLIRRDGSIEPLAVIGERLPLGVRPGTRYARLDRTLAAGDRLLMLSDGLPEALVEEDEPLGYQSLEGLLDHREPDRRRWLEELFRRHEEATTEGVQDDLTALLLEVD